MLQTELDAVLETLLEVRPLAMAASPLILAHVIQAIGIVRARKGTWIVVHPTLSGDWVAFLNTNPGFRSYGQTYGEAVGCLHGYYAMASAGEWPGLRLEVDTAMSGLPPEAAGGAAGE